MSLNFSYVILEKNSCSDKMYGTEAKEGVGGQREAEIVSGTQSTNGYGRSVDERM